MTRVAKIDHEWNHTIPEEVFLQAWVECGFEAKAAYWKLKPDVSEVTAGIMGSRLLGSLRRDGWVDALRGKARDKAVKLIDSKDDGVAQRQVKDFFDRYEGKAQELVDITSANERIEAVQYIVPKQDDNTAPTVAQAAPCVPSP